MEGTATEAVAAFSALAWSAYIVSRLVRRHEVPELVAFLLVGALLGPSGLGLVSETNLRQLELVTQLALAVLMFIIGERVSLRALRAERVILAAGVIQFVVAAGAVYAGLLWLDTDAGLAILLAVLAGAGAPMTIAAVLTQKRAHGRFATGLLGTHAAADALAVLAFAVALPLANVLGADGDISNVLIRFLRLGAGGIVLGLVLGWIVARLGTQVETSGELLLFILVHVLVGSTIALATGLSLPLAALVMGAVAATIASGDTAQRLFVAVRSIEQPLYLLFFGLAGASIHFDAVAEIGAVGIAYIVIRTVAKVVGGTIGGLVGGFQFANAFRLGVDLIPQAGVAVGLAVVAAEELGDRGAQVAAVVLGSVVLFELVGPLLVARTVTSSEEPDDAATTVIDDLDRLPATVLIASPSQVYAPAWLLEWCARSGAELVALGTSFPDGKDVEELRDRAGDDLVGFRFLGFGGESFAGAVVRVAREVSADLVIVVVAPPDATTSRLVLLPHERIARQLTCPVVLLPALREPPEPKPWQSRLVRRARNTSPRGA